MTKKMSWAVLFVASRKNSKINGPLLRHIL
jgi:hypothetical protein